MRYNGVRAVWRMDTFYFFDCRILGHIKTTICRVLRAENTIPQLLNCGHEIRVFICTERVICRLCPINKKTNQSVPLTLCWHGVFNGEIHNLDVLQCLRFGPAC